MQSKKRFRLLIVDDEPAERDGLRFLVEEAGYPFVIHQAANGREALEMLSKEAYDMMLADVKMPFVDGIALSTAAKKMYPKLVIIIISAYGDFEYTQRAIKIRVDDYLLKPIEPSEFQRAVEDGLESLGWVDADPQPEAAPSAEAQTGHVPGQSEAQGGRIVQQVKGLIDKNYMHDIGLEWLADQVYLSPGYLSSLFKRETGKSVVQWITLRRMEFARRQLENTNLKIVDIAQMVGYSNTSYFCLLFRKYYGMTANELREGKNEHA